MGRYDLVLLHPPSVYDFRERPAFFGPIADVIPSSPVFEMYPLGFVTMASYLRHRGFRTRIVNLALLMMRDPDFQVEPFLGRLRPTLFGIDLHWLPHVQGSLEIARLVKRLHPDVPTLFGGISSTYFHQELIRKPQVDFVLRGSVCEPSLEALLRQLGGERRFERVPNLVWKQGGEVRINDAVMVPHTLDRYGFDLGMMIRHVVGRLDFWGNVPFHSWWRHPITAVFTVRGCDRGCVTCGAADAAFRRFMVGHHPFYRSPEGIAAQVRQLAQLTRTPIFLVGDVLGGGAEYAAAVVDALAASPVSNRVTFEFFAPPPSAFIEHIDRSLPHWSAELSPDSHDEAVRTQMEKAEYTNATMEASLEAMLARRCEALDLFFMVGLPGQTYASVIDGIAYVESLFERFDRRLSAYITPMGPFLDPGSDAYEHAEARGYRRFATSLEEHERLLQHRDWEQMLSYETRWMTRRELVDATYDAAERLTAAKVRTGRRPPDVGAEIVSRIGAVRKLRERLQASNDATADADAESALRREIMAFSQAMLNDKRELFPPGAFLRQLRIGGILRFLLADLLAGWRNGRPSRSMW